MIMYKLHRRFHFQRSLLKSVQAHPLRSHANQPLRKLGWALGDEMLNLRSRQDVFRRFIPLCSLRHLLRLSTAITTKSSPPQAHFIVDFLVHSVGFSTEDAISVSCNKFSHLKSTKKPELVLILFKECGLDDTQIKNIVSMNPRLLTSNVEKTLRPKIRYFQELGYSGTDLGNLILGNRSLLMRGLDTHIVPAVGVLQNVVGSKENVIRVITRATWLLSQTPKTIEGKVLLLQKYGIPNNRIQKIILDKPRFLVQKLNWLEKIVSRVEQFGICPGSWMFSYAIVAISSVSKSKLAMKFEVFKSFGWLDSDIVTMTRNQPLCVCSSEEKIRRQLNFLMKDLGYKPKYIASHPKLLLYSLEKRLMPRHVVLRALTEKKLEKLSFYRVACLTESRFVDELLIKHKDKIPEVYEAYMHDIKSTC